MFRRTQTSMVRAVTTVLAAGFTAAAVGGPPDFVAALNERLAAGKLAEAEQLCREAVQASPDDAPARFGLGVTQLFRSVETLCQAHYRHGLREEYSLPFLAELSGPLPANEKPETITYEQLGAIWLRWVADLAEVEKTLAPLAERDVSLPLRVGAIRLDFDGDGTASEAETALTVFARAGGAAGLTDAEARELTIVFDAADVQWVRGYCHLLMGLTELALSLDSRDWFERSAHILFAKPITPHEFLLKKRESAELFEWTEIADLIALVHGINFRVVEPERLKRAHEHLLAMIQHSRVMWRLCLAETDDDREWIPNPKQTGTVNVTDVTAEMVEGWREFLDEAEALLNGKKLIPFWRDAGGKGVNLRRALLESREFDLVYWVQGTAATPFLETGEVTSEAVWNRLQRVFGGEFIGFAVWFN